jgi:hypothetical protein
MILMGAVVVACAAVLGISAACCRVPKTQVHTHYSLSSACVMPHVYVLLLSVVGKRGGGGSGCTVPADQLVTPVGCVFAGSTDSNQD